jgi:hypothetical protein
MAWARINFASRCKRSRGLSCLVFLFINDIPMMQFTMALCHAQSNPQRFRAVRCGAKSLFRAVMPHHGDLPFGHFLADSSTISMG